MRAIPAGEWISEGGVRTAVPSFALADKELSKREWESVRQWATGRGYDLPAGIGETAEHPVSGITWYEAVKFCNAASERAGLEPVYVLQSGEPYRNGVRSAVKAEWEANGYRLPTEAEWEFACRAGSEAQYFWGNEKFPWDKHPYAWCTEHGARGDAVSPQPRGLKKANAFGLYDMSGNVAEWCWDWYAPERSPDRGGPPDGQWRMARGGSVALDSRLESEVRHYAPPGYRVYDLGFRLANSDPRAKALSVPEEEIALPQPERKEQAWDAAETSRRLFALINPEYGPVRPAVALYEEGKYEAALAAYRDYFFQSQRGIPLVPERRNADFGPQASPEEVRAIMTASAGRIYWATPHVQGGDVRQLEFAIKDARKLLKEWEVTGKVDYLGRWFHIGDELARHGKSDFDSTGNAGRATLNPFNTPITWDWGMGFSDAGLLLTELRKIVYAAPEASLLPPRELASIVIFLATDAIGAVIKDSRSAVPNQGISNARAMLNLSHKLPELADAAAIDAEGARRFVAMARSTSLPDGGDLEQSFNYNAALPQYVSSIITMFGSAEKPWLRELKGAAVLRLRMLAAITLPVGGKPSSGSTYSNYAPAALLGDATLRSREQKKWWDEVEKEQGDYNDSVSLAIGRSLFQESASAPAFTSIAFPFSGYYIMRDRWSPDGAFLWFMAARPGLGHAAENINSFELTAYGRTFLTSGGATSYGDPRFAEEDQRPFVREIDAYRARSESRNTVIVDGKSQQRIASNRFTRRKPYDEPIPARWHTSARVDFAEGFYADGYGDGSEAPVEAEHTRQLIYLRDAGIWLVTDQMKAAEAHSYSACWNILSSFPLRGQKTGGFEAGEVHVDANERRISTSAAGQPNMEIWQAAKHRIEYERFWGQLNPARGWIAPGIAGRRFPKVDIWSTWRGEAGLSQLISAIVVFPAEESPVSHREELSTGEQVGIRLLLRDGREVIWLSAGESPSSLKATGIEAEAKGLLVVKQPGGEAWGLALGASTFEADGTPSGQIAAADFEFYRTAAGEWSFTPVVKPEGFQWIETPEGIVPAYHGLNSDAVAPTAP